MVRFGMLLAVFRVQRMNTFECLNSLLRGCCFITLQPFSDMNAEWSEPKVIDWDYEGESDDSGKIEKNIAE